MNGMYYSTVISDSSDFDHAQVRRFFPVESKHQRQIQINLTSHMEKVYHYGMAQVGFSAHITADEGDLILGAPGVLHWAGSIVMKKYTDREHKGASIIANVSSDLKSFEFNDYNGELNNIKKINRC